MEFELSGFADSAFGVAGKGATAQPGGLHVVLVNEPALYVIHKLSGLTSVSKRIVCSRRSPAVRVVTVGPVIRAIAQGHLSLDMAIELNVLEIQTEDRVAAALRPLGSSHRTISATP